LSALALSADASSLTAIGNDYGYEEVFARQVRAHGRAGDVLLVLSTSGESVNLLRAAEVARQLGLVTWALTGALPNALAFVCDEGVAVVGSTATVQECHLAAIHVMCAAVDGALAEDQTTTDAGAVLVKDSLVQPVDGSGPEESRRLVVVGDTVLDRDITGEAQRLSPEAPVPVVSRPSITTRAGGAGMAAVMATQEPGWTVALVTALGADEAGAEVRTLLADAGVHLIDLGTDGGTAVKSRIRAQGRTLLRVDEGPCTGAFAELPGEARDALALASAVLVCDYGRGITAQPDVRAVVEEAAVRVPVVWDPHPRGCDPVNGVTLAVPNASEAESAATGVEGTGLAKDLASARGLLRVWPVRHVTVTRGKLGAVLVHDDQAAPLVVPARPVAAGDECGAGDRFAVTTAVMLGQGWLPSQAVVAAVEAATAYVESGGPDSVTSPRNDPDAGTDARCLVERVRARGGCVVATGGCFDLLHVGHVALLEQARRLGDCLVVCMNSDASVTQLKGESRPLVPARERAAMLQALKCVDAVVVFEEDTPENALARIRPDVYVKGGDYTIGQIPERALVAGWGGQVVIVPYLEGRSTTSLIERALRREGGR
jgi:rfaE bifunctional protein nucleotidyltransferase chain/domain/rfaE bifunctional protein kinase chain/domain